MTVKTIALLALLSVCNALPPHRFSPRGDSFPSILLQWNLPFEPWSARFSSCLRTETNVKRSLSKRGEVIYGICGIGPDSSVRERGMNRTGSFLDHFASIYNSSRSYSINLGPSSSDPNGTAGEVLFGAVDPNKFSGPLVPDTLYEPETLDIIHSPHPN